MPERKSFLLRIDPALWAELEAWAQAELRSVNGQIEYLLKQAALRRKQAPRGDSPAPSPTPTASPAPSQPSVVPGQPGPKPIPPPPQAEPPPVAEDSSSEASDVGWL